MQIRPGKRRLTPFYSSDKSGDKKGSDAFFLPFAITCFVYFLIVYVLPPPLPIRPGAHLLDPSWHIVLTDGFLRGAQFGRDIVYTYGPWGFVENPQGDPRIYPWLFGARLLLALAFVLGSIVDCRSEEFALCRRASSFSSRGSRC